MLNSSVVLSTEPRIKSSISGELYIVHGLIQCLYARQCAAERSRRRPRPRGRAAGGRARWLQQQSRTTAARRDRRVADPSRPTSERRRPTSATASRGRSVPRRSLLPPAPTAEPPDPSHKSFTSLWSCSVPQAPTFVLGTETEGRNAKSPMTSRGKG